MPHSVSWESSGHSPVQARMRAIQGFFSASLQRNTKHVHAAAAPHTAAPLGRARGMQAFPPWTSQFFKAAAVKPPWAAACGLGEQERLGSPPALTPVDAGSWLGGPAAAPLRGLLRFAWNIPFSPAPPLIHRSSTSCCCFSAAGSGSRGAGTHLCCPLGPCSKRGAASAQRWAPVGAPATAPAPLYMWFCAAISTQQMEQAGNPVNFSY